VSDARTAQAAAPPIGRLPETARRSRTAADNLVVGVLMVAATAIALWDFVLLALAVSR